MESERCIRKVGFGAALFAFLGATAYVTVQLLQLLKLLPNPLDEILVYSTSLFIVIPFVLAILALHYVTPEAMKFWTHAALLFTILYAVFVTANYVVQLATVIPATLEGRADEVKLLRQTPHSMFWNFDALGYIFMGLAMLIAVPVLEKRGSQKWVRLSFLANALVTPLISIVYFYPVYSERLLMLGAAWGVTAPIAMLMLALMFRHEPIPSEPVPR
ncbi:MAG TPA: hypothetical protein VKT78_19690 [Fimbriimonadaceae bacterium]|nr:hypothetical protein [Fimbriimonadaceae bacterium]